MSDTERLAATPADRARVDGEVTQEDRDAAADLHVAEGMRESEWSRTVREGRFDDGAAVQAFARHRQAAEQRALAARKRERDWKDKAADWERMAREIEREKLTAEQRVRALVEDAIKVVNDPPMVPPKPLETPVRYYRRRIKLGLRALLPAADGGSEEKGDGCS